MIKGVCFFLCLNVFYSCKKNNTNDNEIFKRLNHNKTGIKFSNDLSLNGDLNILSYMYYYNGGGIAAGDINNDGLVDLFFTGNEVSSKLYINKGNFQFEDITKTSNTTTKTWSTGATMIDINADGWLDIYVCVSGSKNSSERKNQLFINQKDGTFKEMGEAYNLADTSYSTQAAFFDYDLDGDLDMYLLNHSHELQGLNIPKNKKLNGENENTDKLYRNNGLGDNGHPVFEDVSKEAGVTIEGFGLGMGISDINQDGYPDIYVSNDFISNDILYINQGNGTFKNEIETAIKHQSHNGMGNDIADINNDGLTDILVMDMLPVTNAKKKTMLSKPNYDFFEYAKYNGYQPQYMRNTLQLNNGFNTYKPHFSEIGQLSGISSTDWSWACLFADFNLDGNKDLYITNGYLKDMTDLDFIVYRKRYSMFTTKQKVDSMYLASIIKLPEIKQQNFIYKNNGDLTFTDVSKEWVSPSPTFSNGAVYVDLDNDGDLDIVINNLNEFATVLKNLTAETSKNKHLTINFNGSKNNPNGIGSKVWVYSNKTIQFSENNTTRGFQSAMAPQLHFGFPKSVSVDSLKVIWSDGKTEVLKDINLNSKLVLNYHNAREESKIKKPNTITLFTEITNGGALQFNQKEMTFPDFNREPLIPKNYSNNGPGISVSDVNGDNLDDIYIGGSFGYSGKLFKQKANGTFDSISMPFDKKHEDMGSLFFDADNDGDNDLYVVSGSSEIIDGAYYQDQLYINDGKGNFSKTNSLPEINSSGSIVIASDYDNDGDLDLFVGGRVVPGKYGKSPKSYLLNNENGMFKDVTNSMFGTSNLGMISSALWTDYNNDGWVDLIIVGEWMPITIYKNINGKLFEKIELENSNGWWNSVNGGDFDNDGDIDYIVGNLGENSFFKASVEHPITLALGDFDKDGKIDTIISTYCKDPDGIFRSYPFASRDLLADQMLFIKNKFLTYKQYSSVTIKELALNTPYNSLKVTNLKSVYLENTGNGKFKVHNLPLQAQFAPVMGTTINDFDLDGNLDVLLVGNFHHAEVGYGQYDASLGLYLKGNGNGQFTVQNFSTSGFMVDGDARALTQVATSNGNLILATQNNNNLKVFKLKPKGKTINIGTKSKYGIINLLNGKKRKVEFYNGESYLSQSSKIFSIQEGATIQVFNNY